MSNNEVTCDNTFVAAAFADIDINDIARRQHDWVERMGWHNKNDLESMALIASEVGEAVAECVGDNITPEFGMELADIILRVADLAETHRIDLERQIIDFRYRSVAGEVLPCRTAPESLAYLMIVVARATNHCRRCETTGDLPACLAEIIVITQMIAARAGLVDLSSCIEKKMAINESRGTRGRAV